MSKRKIFDFLRDLKANNSKEWMDANRDRYHQAKQIWLDEIETYLKRLSKHAPGLEMLRPKDTIMRINNNQMYHPEAPTYKDSFGFDPMKGKGNPSYYVHISPSGSFIGGGLYKPSSDLLKKVRAAIDYDGQKLKAILQYKKLQEFYGGLAEDPDELKTSPKGYDQEHRHIDLLRRKNFHLMRSLTQKEVLSDDFDELLEEAFVIMQPFNAYLRKAIDF